MKKRRVPVWENYTKREPNRNSLLMQITGSHAFDNAEYKFDCGAVILVRLGDASFEHIGMTWGQMEDECNFCRR